MKAQGLGHASLSAKWHDGYETTSDPIMEGIMQPRISMITLGVKDLNAAVEFYQQGLGLPRREPYSDGMAFFDLNGTWLGLYPWDKLAEDATVPPEGTGFRGVTLAHNVKSKEEVNAVMSQAIAAGATQIKEPQDVFWGGYSGYFADLDGHLWEVAWNPHSWIGPEDTDG